MKTGADHLRDWIERRGFTAQEAAHYLRVEPGHLSLLLSQKRTRLGLDVACRIERATGIPVEVWLPGAQPKAALRRQQAEALGDAFAVAHAEEG